MPRSNFTLFSASPRLSQWMCLRSRRRNRTSHPQVCLLPIRVFSRRLAMELSARALTSQPAQPMRPQTSLARVLKLPVASAHPLLLQPES
jgi:hypothetical protein